MTNLTNRSASRILPSDSKCTTPDSSISSLILGFIGPLLPYLHGLLQFLDLNCCRPTAILSPRIRQSIIIYPQPFIFFTLIIEYNAFKFSLFITGFTDTGIGHTALIETAIFRQGNGFKIIYIFNFVSAGGSDKTHYSSFPHSLG